MLDNRFIQQSQSVIFCEMSDSDKTIWFDFKRQSFIHNIDTFYYSVKLTNDFIADSDEPEVIAFRNFADKLKDRFRKTMSPVSVEIPGMENRVDYCWHTNYFDNPNKFFTINNFYKMKVSRFNGSFMHASNVGSDDYELDYIAMGKRGDKCFVRIYLKTKEVIQKGYKQYFLKAWLFEGLINRYDFYCLEYAFNEASWQALTIGRLKFYLDYGKNEMYRMKCREYIEYWNSHRKVNDAILKLADLLTPKVHNVINIEYQTMRKMSKTFELHDWPCNTDMGHGVPIGRIALQECSQLFLYFKNMVLIRNYLTHDVLRLVKKSGDTNKSRREDCAFWKRLCSVKSDYDIFTVEQKKLLRNYQYDKSIERLKRDTLRKAVTYGLYFKGKNSQSPLQDAFDALLTFNDNDIYNADLFKTKKIKELNFDEFPDFKKTITYRDLQLFDRQTGCIYGNDNISDLLSQDDDENVSW